MPDAIEPQNARPIRAKTRATLVAAIARGRRWLKEVVDNVSTLVEGTVLWIRGETGRNLLMAAIAVVGVAGWVWGFRLWRRRRDAVQQIQVLEEKLVALQQRHVTLRQKLDDLPDMMTRVFVPCFNFLMRSLVSKLPARDQQGVLARLQRAMEGDGRSPSLMPSQFAPPMRFENRRLSGRRSGRRSAKPLLMSS